MEEDVVDAGGCGGGVVDGGFLEWRVFVSFVGVGGVLSGGLGDGDEFYGLNWAGDSGSEPVGVFALRPGYKGQDCSAGIVVIGVGASVLDGGVVSVEGGHGEGLLVEG